MVHLLAHGNTMILGMTVMVIMMMMTMMIDGDGEDNGGDHKDNYCYEIIW